MTDWEWPILVGCAALVFWDKQMAWNTAHGVQQAPAPLAPQAALFNLFRNHSKARFGVRDPLRSC